MAEPVVIAGRPVGLGQPPYVVAEMSANHLGRLDRALAIVEAAKAAGADAIKLQTYTADTMTIDSDEPGFTITGGLWDGRRLYELYEKACTPWEWHEPLFARAAGLGLTIFSSPFDESAIDFLERLDAPAYKIASFEAIDLPLIRRAARTGRPVIVSTGMATLGEIEETVEVLRAGNARFLLLHCVSGYPTPPAEANLRTMRNLSDTFAVEVGLSDHTPGTSVAVAAVALGACMIEKHFTLSRADGGPDAAFSLEPAELATLVRDTRTAWEALGKVTYEQMPSERGMVGFRRSLYVVRDVAAGESFTQENVRAIRPGLGLPPKSIEKVLGRPAAKAVRRGTPLSWSLVGGRDDS